MSDDTKGLVTLFVCLTLLGLGSMLSYTAIEIVKIQNTIEFEVHNAE